MPNRRPIRRGQLITPFGVGALVDFRGDESLMTAGLDEWPDAKDECPRDWLVQEERLQARLGVSHFRLPPEYREPGEATAREQAHPVRPLSSMALLPTTRSDGEITALRWALKMSMSSGSRLPFIARKPTSLVDSQSIYFRMSKGTHRRLPVHGMDPQGRNLGPDTQAPSSPRTLLCQPVGDQGAVQLRSVGDHDRHFQLRCHEGRRSSPDRLRLLRKHALAWH